jgi:hypothetical protein
MFVVIETKLNQFTELPPGSTIVSTDGVQHPWQITSLWSDAELEFINVYRVEPTPIPEGKASVDFKFERDATGVIRQVHTLVDAPLAPVTPRQIRLALTQMGLRQAVEAYVQQQDVTVQDSWTYASEFLRDNELIIAAARALNKSDSDIDVLFGLARSL